jgi:hypothetical protein
MSTVSKAGAARMKVSSEIKTEEERERERTKIRGKWGDRPRSCGQRFHWMITETDEHGSE